MNLIFNRTLEREQRSQLLNGKMDNHPFTSYEIEDRSFVSFIKRDIRSGATQAGFNEARVGVIDIAVSELTSNIIKHAESGELLYRFSTSKKSPVFEIFCLDNGPGIKDVLHSMKDGVTTTKTLGHGLGALKRLSDVFHIYSKLKWGTVCYSKICASPSKHVAESKEVKFGAVNISKPGQVVSGDGFQVISDADYTKIFMGDGLGHGKEAFDAVQLAITNFKLCEAVVPSEILRFISEGVKKSRGLVATTVVLDHKLKKWKICGVGNIATRLFEGLQSKNYMNHNGIVGLNVPTTLQDHETDFNKHQCFILTSDGIRTRWDLSQFPSILRYDPMMLAAVIYKENARKNDDMSILVVRT